MAASKASVAAAVEAALERGEDEARLMDAADEEAEWDGPADKWLACLSACACICNECEDASPQYVYASRFQSTVLISAR